MTKLRTLLALCLSINLCFAQDVYVPTSKDFGFNIKQKVKCTSVKDQAKSGTCWSFASISLIESELIKQGKGSYDLSEMYIARHSYINKAYQYLKYEGKVHLTPGGQYHDVMRVVRKHGIMPEEAYNGLPGNATRHIHADMDSLMKEHILKMLAEGKKEPNTSDLAYMNKILDKYLGAVPKDFMYKGKKYTPMSFMKDYLKFNPEDYIEVTSYTHHPFYKPFVLEDKYNWTKDEFYNVPVDEFMQIIDEAIKNNHSVCWDGDVSEPTFKFANGLAYLPEEQNNVTQELRQTTYEDQSSKIDHMMHIVGVANDKSGNKWYWVKNSWGDDNPDSGFIYMSEPYMKLKTIAIIVHKDAIPKDIRKKLKI